MQERVPVTLHRQAYLQVKGKGYSRTLCHMIQDTVASLELKLHKSAGKKANSGVRECTWLLRVKIRLRENMPHRTRQFEIRPVTRY